MQDINELTLREIIEDFDSLLDWYIDWHKNNKDIIVFYSFAPYLCMFIIEANCFSVKHNVMVGDKKLGMKLSPTIAKIRSRGIKLYNIDYDKNFNKLSKVLIKNKAFIEETGKALDKYYGTDNGDNFSFFIYNNQIVSTFHLLDRINNKKAGIFIECADNMVKEIKQIIECVVGWTSLLLNETDRAILLYRDFETFSFNKLVKEQSNKMNLESKKLGVYVAYFDIVSVINFYLEFVKNSKLSKKIKFKIKYLIFSEALICINNISKYEKQTYGVKTFYDKELTIIDYKMNSYVKNAVINLCKHYDFTKLKLNSDCDDIFVYGIEFYLSKNFDIISEEIDSSIIEFKQIIDSHFKTI